MKRSEIERLLPEVFQRTVHPGEPLFALLEVMQYLGTPCDEALARLDDVFNPYRAPDRFVPMLAGWVDLDRFLTEESPEDSHHPDHQFPGGLGSLRELIVNAAFLSKWRGTARGLRYFLETATAVPGFVIEEQPLSPDQRPRPFHIRVHAPERAQAYRRLIERIVNMEKPAYVTYDIQFVATSAEVATE